MTGRPQIEGCNLIQSTEISSSTDVLISYFANSTFPTYHFPRARPSYRNEFYPGRGLQYLENLVARPRMPELEPEPEPIVLENPDPINRRSSVETLSTRTALMYVALIFLGSLFLLLLLYASFPELTQEERSHIRLPWNIEQAKNLGIVLNRYKNDHYSQVLGAVFITYIFLQTFAIPGSLFLSILSGYLFPFLLALILVCTCSATGASLCFLLSQLLGRKLVLKYFPEKARSWAVTVNKHRDNLFNYVVFLRITPFLPNWFINLTAPVIGVPLKPFALGTFIGVAPPSFVAIQTGQTLYEMTGTESAFSWTSVSLLAVFAVLSLIPIFFKHRLKEKFD